METIWIDEERCTLCGTCIPLCPRRVIEEGDAAVKITDPARCMLCGHCKAVCPENAPQLPALREEEFEAAPSREALPGPDQVMALLRSRRSTRIYRDKPVDREHLQQIVEAGRFAPSGGNRQPLRYVLVHTTESVQKIRSMTIEALLTEAKKIEEDIRKKEEGGTSLSADDRIKKLYSKLWQELAAFHERGIDKLFYAAPSLVICHLDPKTTVTAGVDAGIAAMQMILMAEALGVGTCLCAFLCVAAESSPELRKGLQIPDGHMVPFSFMAGYPDITYLRLVSRNPAQVQWL
jgi:nitroreductase/NAD-dependent dihydropyrimidine dehydrogenase PreA subunit